VPASEREPRATAALDALAAAVERYVDLDAVMRLAQSAPAPTVAPWSPEPDGGPAGAAHVAIARGPAFSFHYEENLELLTAAGARLEPFDPTVDERLPAGSDALILAGGFPEVFGAELAANAALRCEVAAFARSGRPVLAECGGLLYLCEGLDDHAMCGVLPARGEMAGRLTLGYREAVAATATPWLDAGQRLRGHEFHYSRVLGELGAPAWTLSAGGRTASEGYVACGVQASYLHTHWAATPDLAARFVAAAIARRPAGVAE
jgi:cobyrinic acid a,c-diamide synthase